MSLSNQDVQLIESQGFNTKFFISKRKGWLQLKNKDGKCVFNNGKKCIIYKNRPEGCRLYPVIFDKDKNCAVLDRYCPYKDNFKISKMKVERLFDLVSKLEYEKIQRKTKKDISKRLM
jgi:Fe-S-cluster containining protein